jgi:hypothetical protein
MYKIIIYINIMILDSKQIILYALDNKITF